MIGPRFVGLLLIGLTICALAFPPSALTDSPAPPPLSIRVDSILAANTGKGMDTDLSPDIGVRLKTLFDYSTYRLVLHQRLETICGHSVSFEIPGGGVLRIAPHSFENNMISLDLVLFEGQRPIMNSELRMINNAVLMVGGPHYRQGTMITVITIGSTDSLDRPTTHPRVQRQSKASPHASSPNAGMMPAGAGSLPQQ
jgi:hypothetical protein